ncbi:hypothetical protein Mapa_012747 [Marchantia paleacea]|nr:hypothetical protein Mapa_012747 [Marchantia paleacea]
MRKVTLLRALHYSFARRWTAIGDLPFRAGRSGLCTSSGLGFEPVVHADNHCDSSDGSTYSNNYATRSKLGMRSGRARGETFILASTLNSGSAQPRRKYSSLPEPNVDVGGIVPVPLAQTGEGIADCELLRWFVQEGDEVDEFQPLCEVQSDKASVEITSRYKGKVTRVLYIPGDIVKVGETLLELLVDGDHSLATPVGREEKSESELTASDSTSSSPGSGHGQKEVQATPAVRQLAKAYGIDLSAIIGTGKDGRILKDDIIKAALFREELNEEMRGISESSRGTEGSILQSESSSDSDCSILDVETGEIPVENVSTAVKPFVEDNLQEDQIIPVRGFRRIMAKTMAAAVTVPHFHYTEDIEMNSIVQLKKSLKDMPLEKGVKLTYLPFLIKALSLALLKYPIMNSTVNQEVSEIHVLSSHNIGVGMATSSGLVVPNIKNVQRLCIMQIAEELSRLTQLAATNKLSNEDVTGGTITVSNFGSIGGKYGSPVISVPEVAIVAIGKIQTLPRYNSDGILYPASIMGVTWGADHRVIDGATVASFCNQWKVLIEQPGRFLLNMR